MRGLFVQRSALIGAVLLAGGTCATAQEMHVAVSKVESGEWFWVAIYSGAVATPYVESVVALRDPATATGDNLRVVEYTRGATWTSQAWTTAEPWEAINWIKDDLGLSDTEDDEWGICNDAGVEESVPPVDYTDGMLAEDPWAPIVLALIVGAVVWGWYGNPLLGAVIAVAMVVNLLVAGMAGILVPIGLDKLGADPALASGTFVTTVTDIVGFFVFLGLAAAVLL